MTEEVQTIRLDGIEYRLPYAHLIDQTVDDESLVASINKEGMIYPIVYRKTEKGREIIDGNTRARLIADGKVKIDKVPLEQVEVEEDEHAYDLAIQLNFQRRQISPEYRRETIKRIHDHKNWRGKPSSHVKVLAELLGVSKATISKDIARIWDQEEESEIRNERVRINYLLTGLGYLDGEKIRELDVSDEFKKDEIEVGQRYIQAVRDRLKARRDEINKALKTDEDEAA